MSFLGYILVFYIGFYFFRLAENYNRNKWLYGLLGILFFFGGLFAYTLFVRFFKSNEINEFDIAMISIKSILVGVFVSFIMFHVLDFLWKKSKK